MSEPTKRCGGCREDKPLSAFHDRGGSRQGQLNSYCKQCGNKATLSWRRKNRLGVTREQYAAMLGEQEGCCAICSKQETSHAGRGLNVDHSHLTGQVRGLLCVRCNTALGLLGDDTAVLENAIAYLRSHEEVM